MSKLNLMFSLMIALAGGVVAFSRVPWPADPFWESWRWLIPCAVGVTVVAPLASSLISEVSERRKRKRAELSGLLRDSLAGLFITIVDAAKADWRSTGLQVFVVRRRWYWFGKRQVLEAKLRLRYDAPNKVVWTKGKGVIGACWDDGQPKIGLAEARLHNCTQDEWARLTASKQIGFTNTGLTFKEFTLMREKYGLIVAFPLTKGTRYLGCITADFPPEYVAGVDAQAVKNCLSGAAPSISALVARGE